MYSCHQWKKMKVFAVRFSVACALAAFAIGIFAYLKYDAPAARAGSESSARPEIADDMPILFIRSNDIWKISVNGSTEQRLTQTTEPESFARWSPDGRKILYQKNVGGIFQLWTMNSDGTNQTNISEPGIVTQQGRWSPNGQKILFVKNEVGGTDQLWVMNPDGSGKTRITNNGFNDHVPQWSPDGSKIAVGRCNADYLSCDIAVMDADGTDQLNLTSNNMGDDDSPFWSPDSSKIVYTSQNTSLVYNVSVTNIDGTNQIPLTNVAAPQFYQVGEVSPLGNKVLLQLSSGGLDSLEISTVGIDGSNLRQLTVNNVYDANAKWSPDGTKIAFFSRRDTATGEIYIMDSEGNNVIRLTNNAVGENITDWRAPLSPSRTAFDYDGDGKADISVFRPNGGNWYISNSLNGSFSAVQFGVAGDLLAPADYDGDGKTDISVFRSSDGTWYRLNSANNTFAAAQFGTSGDLPVPGDFDGDQKADITVYRPSAGIWYRVNSSNNQFVAAQFGIAEDKPLIADFDGDEKSDLAVWRPSSGIWYRINSGSGSFSAAQFGQDGDKVVPADYDGDGKTDLAVWRPTPSAFTTSWYRINSSNGEFVTIPQGANIDTPAPADFDGDGKADLVLFRASLGTWYLNRSTAGFTSVQFGTEGDVPTPNAFIR